MTLFKYLYLIFLLPGLISGLAFAEEPTTDESPPAEKKFYKKYGPDGQVIYSDRPDKTTEEITLPKGTVYTPVERPVFKPAPSVKKPIKFQYSRFTITKPVNEGINWNNYGLLEVSIELVPSLQPGHKLVYMLDGVVAREGTETEVTLPEVNPGSHKLEVAVHDSQSQVLQSTSIVTYQKRHLIKQKVAPFPPAKP